MLSLQLTVKNLYVNYNNQQILHDINFSVTAGQSIGILGGSGNGKTTLLNTLACSLPAEAAVSGSISWNGSEIIHKKLHEKLRGSQITMLPQQPGDTLFPLHTIKKHFYLLLQAYSRSDKEAADQKAASLLARLQLDNPRQILNSYPYQLSGGIKQRICLALCLLPQPQLLLADEPTAGLDVVAQAELLKLLLSLRQTRNMSMIITSHNPGFLLQAVDNIIILHRGSIIETNTPKQLYRQPQAEYTRQLLNAADCYRL